MTNLIPNRRLSKSDTALPCALTVSGYPDAAAEQLMPFGLAAKAIFVKANGLQAYYKAQGPLCYTA